MCTRLAVIAACIAVVFAAAPSLQAQCGVPTAYALSPSVLVSASWEDSSGSVWLPAGGYPGCTAGDTAILPAVAAVPPTLSVSSPLPFPLTGLNLACGGCTIEILGGAELVLDGAGTATSGDTVKTSGGTFAVAASGTMTFQSGSTLQIDTGAAEVRTGGQLALDGTTTVNSGTLFVQGTVTTSTQIATTGVVSLDGGTINGTGSIESSGSVESSGLSTIAATLNGLAGGSGVEVNDGTLTLSGGGNGDSPFVIGPDSVLAFQSASYTMTANGVVSGLGTLSLSSGLLAIGGVTNPGGFAMSGGVLTGAGFLSVMSTFTWSGGVIAGTGGTQLEGSGNGYFTGVDGSMELARAFDNYGYIEYSGGTGANGLLLLSDNITFANYGTFDFTDDGSIDCGDCNIVVDGKSPVTNGRVIIIGSGGLFSNPLNGLVVKSGGTGTSTIYIPSMNDSEIVLFTGSLEFAGDGTHSGAFFGSADTTFVFSAANSVITGGVVLTDGDVWFSAGGTSIDGFYDVYGQTEIDGATVEILGTAYTTDFLFDTGLFLVDDFHMAGLGLWSCGTIADGDFTVDDGATLTIDSANSTVVLSSAFLNNSGTVNYTATVASGNSFDVMDGGIVNYGLFDIQSDQPISVLPSLPPDNAFNSLPEPDPLAVLPSTNTFVNDGGTLQKSAETGATVIELDLANGGTVLALSGTMNFTGTYVQTVGATTLGPGSIETPTLELDGGVLDGNGTITGDVQNDAGDLNPGDATNTGVIDITGNFTQTSTLTVVMDIAGASPGEFDQLNITGTATFGGGFEANLLGGYEPADGTTWNAITFASSSGAFDSEVLPTYAGTHGSIVSSYTPTAYVLTAVVTPLSADLTIGMIGPATIDAGDPLAYVITVGNSGPDPITGTTTVVNTLPAGATGASASGGGWSCGAPSGGTITCTSTDTIASGNSFPQLTIAMTAPVDPASVQNSATASNAIGDPTTPNTASVNTTVIGQADLTVSKSGPNGVIAGQNVVYTIVVTNNGPSSSDSVVIADPTPANLTFVSNSGDCTSPFPCSLGTLTAGQSKTITATYSTSPSFSGDVTNTATASAVTFDPSSANNGSTKVTNVGAQADLSVVKSGPAAASPGQNVTYTIVVTNNGPSPAPGTVVSDPTPVGIAFLSNTGACTTAFPCALGTLAAGQSATITSTYGIPGNYAPGSVVNTASASSAVNDPNAPNDSSTITTTMVPQADLSITKTGPSSTAPGTFIVYTIVVGNGGPASATNVVVTDPTPAGLTPVSNAGACTTAFPCNLGTLAAGSTATITSTFSIPANYSGASITNIASVDSDASDGNAANDSSTVNTAVVAQADVAIVKTGPATFDAGQNVSYTLVVTNNGPLTASNVVVDDTTPAGLTFASNSGACTGPFPCALGALAAGQTATITTTFSVPAAYSGTSITNTATVSAASVDVNAANDSSTAITPRVSATAADVSISKSGPPTALSGSVVVFQIQVHNAGPSPADNVIVNDPSVPGLTLVSSTNCATGFPCALGTIAAGQTEQIIARYFVTAGGGQTVTNTATVSSSATDSQPSNNTSSASVSIVDAPVCPSRAPVLISPTTGQALTAPVKLLWTAVSAATGYVVTLSGPAGTSSFNHTGTTIELDLEPGAYQWSVMAVGHDDCGPTTSPTSSFVVCVDQPTQPVISAIAETNTDQTYGVFWEPVLGAASYLLEESTNPTFAGATVTTHTETSASYTKIVTSPTGFYYRVRALSACGILSEYSHVVRVAVLPAPVPSTSASLNMPFGSTHPATFQVFVPGLPAGTTTFIATVDKPWLTVAPTSGIIPPEGILLTVSSDPSGLPNGTSLGTVVVVYGAVSVARGVQLHGNTTFSIPVAISLVTPITPTPLSSPAASAMIIPAVGHLAGLSSNWRSDVRVANTSSAPQKYKVSFNSGSGDPADLLKTTVVTVDGGGTIALDDVVRSWYGVGSLGESSNGALTIEPLGADGKVSPVASSTTSVSSRTFNASEKGTLGQFVPALPFPNFLKSGGNSLLSLQQISQSSTFRTNLGVLESSGKPASVTIGVFNELGAKLLDLPLSLKAGEQRQLNGFLAENGLSLPNGRIEVKFAGGDGSVTTYASVVDNQTGDPYLVFGAALDGDGDTRFVVPGVADLDAGAQWRSDVRLFNSGDLPQTATLTFFPTGDPASSSSKSVTINPDEVKALDGVLQSVFGLHNVGGALHVTTPTAAPLVVTARTYDQRPGGTVGQFVPAVSPGEAVGVNGRTLQILQAEESSRYRTNLGIAEVTGQAVVVEVMINLPDSKVKPVVRVPLAANEFRQFPVLSSLGLGALYNTRVSVRVIEGQGRVTAYGSVIDSTTGDPTYIPAQ